MSETLYLDNAATSWPKAPGVSLAMAGFLDGIGASPGRSAHRRSLEAGRIVDETRERVAALFGAEDPLRVVFGANITWALNLALRGLLRPGDRCVVSGMEHNAMMRPLRQLEREGVSIEVVPCGTDGTLDPARMQRALQEPTRLVGMLHASNVCGTILPFREVAALARDAGAFFLLDTATTAGALPIDMERDGVDLLAFTGHKTLLGPPGTGGLIFGPRVPAEDLAPLERGGTGSRSEEEEQPHFLPDRFESGTPNTVGLAGLLAALEWIEEAGTDFLAEHRQRIVSRLVEGLRNISGVKVHGVESARERMSPVSFVVSGLDVGEASLRLDEEWGLCLRPGLHCAPAAHRSLGTYPEGSLRLAPGPFTTEEEIDRALSAVEAVAAGGRR